ncbi:MAG: hypothetical protein CVU08_13520 [Bacteroidetes bacterium HGW-Bacteroidetes-3]|jgi:hypothetical protein|nr:MAG: hypothetical protein CVU08_13520 [Bacteroidetes bacterium HGW-Bacteroidetes-3]
MSDFRNRPKRTYIFDANWEELYVLAKHWKSDLLFYKDDLKFLDHLIDKYFIWISNKKDVDAVRKIDNSILETAKKCSDLLKRVEKHLTHLAGLMEDPFKYDSHQFRTEHQQLEDEITNFVKVFRNNRKEVFEVTSLVVESDDFIRQFVVK